MVRAEDVGAAAKVLARFTQEMTFLEKLIPRYYETSQVATIAAPLILLALPAVTKRLREVWTADHERNLSAAKRILESTSIRLDILPATTARNFHTLFTGPLLRLEIIGVILSLAGLASLYLPAHDATLIMQNGFNRREFALEMADLSDTCIGLCERSNAVNDLWSWLLYENLVLSTLQHGDSSRLGFYFRMARSCRAHIPTLITRPRLTVT